jgi:hypothetical protein
MATSRVEGYRRQFQLAHEWLEGTVEGMSNEEANFKPSGKAMPAGAHYVHHVQGEDAIFNGMLGGKPMLMAEDYAGKIGASEPAPQGDWSDWARSATFDMTAARAYAQAVYASTDAYLAGLSESDLTAEVDLSGWGIGMQPVSYLLDVMLLDTGMHMGEISAAKGLQGLRGYPF